MSLDVSPIPRLRVPRGSGQRPRPPRWRLVALASATGLMLAAGLLVPAGMAGPAAAADSGQSVSPAPVSPAPSSPAPPVGGGRQDLPAYVPMWATLIADDGSATADLGPAAAAAPVSARVYLAGRDPRGLAAYATVASEPRSRLFHHYLSPAQVQRWFGPTAGQVAAVKAWVTRSGLEVTGVTSHYVAVSGDAAEAEEAFGIEWDSFSVAGRTQQSPPPGAQVTAPVAVAPAVLTVVPVETGLPTSAPPPAPEPVPAPPSPCSEYYGQDLATSLPDAYGSPAPYAACGYTPQQLRSAYGVPARLAGQGVTVAVVHPWAYPTAAQDLATFAARHGEPLRPGQFTQILPKDLNASCPDGIQAGHARATNEEDLDVEAVHAMAPAADIEYFGAECDDDFGTLSVLDALTQVTDQHLASIVSDSSGVPVASPGVVAAYEQVFEQGAAEGIGFYAPSGDSGDNAVHTTGHQPMPPVYPASDPWVTAVGGTTLAIGQHGTYEWEVGWGDDDATLAAGGTSWTDLPGNFTAGAGGGASPLFPQPAYQRGVVPISLSEGSGSSAPERVVPDVAADADPATGLVIGVTGIPAPGQPAAYVEFPGAGTSISTPIIVGLQADAQQAARTAIGFANPAIYARYGTSAFHDVTDQPLGPGVTLDSVLPASGATPALLETFGLDEGLTATPGYDDVTGVGTPAASYFATRRRD
jgi:subtilase family serine protease